MHVRIGVVGLGAMGQNHARVAAELGYLHAVMDIDPVRARQAQRRWGVPAVANFADMADDVDAVIIATPTISHLDHGLAALEMGLHLLVEKPIAPSVAEGRRLVDAAAAAGLVLSVGHIERHNPVVRWTKNMVDGGNLGRILSMSARRVGHFPGRIQDVGCILDIGIHEIDAAMYLIGDNPSIVFAQGGSHKAGGFEDHATIQIGFEAGASAVLEVNWLTPRRVREAALTCTDALLEYDYVSQVATISRSSFIGAMGSSEYDPAVEHDVQRFAMRRREPLRNEIEDFVAAIRTKGRPLVTGPEGLSALAVAEAALASLRTGQAINLANRGDAPIS